jgi:hypothetical protein
LGTLIADAEKLNAQVVTLTQKLQVAEHARVVSDAFTAAHNTQVKQLKEQQQQQASTRPATTGFMGGLFASGRRQAAALPAETTFFMGAAVPQPGAITNNIIMTENKNTHTHTGPKIKIGDKVANAALGSDMTASAVKAVIHAKFGQRQSA